MGISLHIFHNSAANMESDGVDFEEVYSLMESSLFSFQCIWSTKKKRSSKSVKSKEFSSGSSGSSREEGGVRSRPVIFRVYSRKRKRLSPLDDVQVIPKAASHDKLHQHPVDDDDDGIVLGDWIRQMRRIRVKSEEGERKESEMKTVSVTKVEPLEDHGCTILPSWGSVGFTSKRKKRRRVGLEVKSEVKSMSVMEVEPSEDQDCGILASRRKERRQVELEEDVAWEEELHMISKIKTTNRRRRRGSHSPEHVTRASGSRSRSPASEVSDSLVKNGCSDDCASIKITSKVTCLYRS